MLERSEPSDKHGASAGERFISGMADLIGYALISTKSVPALRKWETTIVLRRWLSWTP
jgi:hypothetical protein